MFLCDDCAIKSEVTSFEALFGLRSFGMCESCGESKSCIDAHSYGNKITKSQGVLLDGEHLENLKKWVENGDYCFLCDNHPSSGHDEECPLRDKS